MRIFLVLKSLLFLSTELYFTFVCSHFSIRIGEIQLKDLTASVAIVTILYITWHDSWPIVTSSLVLSTSWKFAQSIGVTSTIFYCSQILAVHKYRTIFHFYILISLLGLENLMFFTCECRRFREACQSSVWAC